MTFAIGDRVTVRQGYESSWENRTGVVVDPLVPDYSRPVTEIRFDDNLNGNRVETNRFYTNQLVLIEPAKPPKNDARSLRGKIAKRIEAYKAIENPTVAVKAVIEELEGVLSL